MWRHSGLPKLQAMDLQEQQRANKAGWPQGAAPGAQPSPASRPVQPHWLVRYGATRCPSFRLFCFPYAGGSASAYRDWHSAMDARIEVLALQLPGRGARLGETPVVDFGLLADRVTDVVAAESHASPFAFFGHSLGALLMFEVTRRLQARAARWPECMFASGRPAPHLPHASRRGSAMSDAELIDELQRLDGTPREVFQHPDLLAIVLPHVRADFVLLDNWRFEPSPPLDIPICALAGMQDSHASLGSVAAWSEWTSAGFELLTYPGGHFFLHEHEIQVAHDVSDRMTAVRSR